MRSVLTMAVAGLVGLALWWLYSLRIMTIGWQWWAWGAWEPTWRVV
mgnify:CR=1 FL=1